VTVRFTEQPRAANARSVFVLTSDEVMAISLAADLLEHGFAARVFTGVRALLDGWARGAPAVVLLDTRFGGTSGGELLALLCRGSELAPAPVVPIEIEAAAFDPAAPYRLDRVLAAVREHARGADARAPEPDLPRVAPTPRAPMFRALAAVRSDGFLAEAAPPAPAAPAVAPAVEAAAAPTALVADPNPVVRRLLGHHLRRLGWTVVEAEDGEAAEDALDRLRPAVALLDAHLPFRGAFEIVAARRAGAERCPTRLVVLSVQSQDEHALRAYTLGSDDFIAKPFNPEVVARRVQRLVTG
jgi:DNA-binding response OmpR family regulator